MSYRNKNDVKYWKAQVLSLQYENQMLYKHIEDFYTKFIGKNNSSTISKDTFSQTIQDTYSQTSKENLIKDKDLFASAVLSASNNKNLEIDKAYFINSDVEQNSSGSSESSEDAKLNPVCQCYLHDRSCANLTDYFTNKDYKEINNLRERSEESLNEKFTKMMYGRQWPNILRLEDEQNLKFQNEFTVADCYYWPILPINM